MRGRCVVRGGIRDPPFFWQFVNGAHGTAVGFRRVVSLERQHLRRIRPLFRGGIPCCLFIACGRPNQEQSSLLQLTVLLLLRGERQEEGDGASEREDGIPGVWAPQGFFSRLRSQYVFFLLRFSAMDLLKACDEMKVFIETAQKLVDAWDADPDNYSQLEEGLTALKAALEK